MTDPVTDSVTRYERDTNTVRNAAPHHTTPHHTTKNTSSRCMALADVIETLRPEWSSTDIAKALAADDRPWRTVVLASIRGAAGDDIRHPNGLRYVNPDGVGGTPLPPTVRELRTAPTCQHGAASGLCALCRNGVE
jgi:hypothetical protein